MTAPTGIELIAAERQRQIDRLGYTAAHDQEHDDGELALVAALYATPIVLFEKQEQGGSTTFQDPWPDLWYKDHSRPKHYDAPLANSVLPRSDRIRQLAKAGALIAAEIDRLQRLQAEEDPA